MHGEEGGGAVYVYIVYRVVYIVSGLPNHVTKRHKRSRFIDLVYNV